MKGSSWLSSQRRTAIPAYLTPGIYQTLDASTLSSIGLVRTDIAGFAGFTERGPLAGGPVDDPASLAVKLTSWKEFRARFGGFFANGYLPYAVRAFFQNGGTTCYVVRVADTDAASTAFLAVPGAPLSVPVTALSANVKKGDAELPVDYAGVLSPGSMFSVTGLGAAEFFSVAAIKDNATVRVTRAAQTYHAKGDEVARLTGRYQLNQDAFAGQTDVVVNDIGDLRAGDLVVINGTGVSEASPIAATLPLSSSIRLSVKLRASHSAGDVILRHGSSFTVQAASPGNWGNRIRLQIYPLEQGGLITKFALRVKVDAGFDATDADAEEFYPRLSVDMNDRNSETFAPTVINANSRLIRIVFDPDSESPTLVGAFDSSSVAGPVYLTAGRDGLSTVDDRHFIGGDAVPRGLKILEYVEEVSILCAPDAVFDGPAAMSKPKPPGGQPCDPPAPVPQPDPVLDDPSAVPPAMTAFTNSIYQAMIEQCERVRYRVAVLDPPPRLAPTKMERWLSLQSGLPASPYAALYYPWLKVPANMGGGAASRMVPPSGFVAGIYAWTDLTYGVQRPPANVEVDLAVDVAQEIDDRQQGNLNRAGINAIRAFPGRGIRVWGARALAGGEWRFIHVRRLMSAIEESVEKSTQWAVFEPNDANLRSTLVHSLNVFLEGFWRKGGLKGTSPDQAFFVKCDATNNPQSVIDAGALICQVGVAVAAPMEFLIFEIRRMVDFSEVVEA